MRKMKKTRRAIFENEEQDMNEPKPMTKPTSLLEAFEQIVEAAEDSELSDGFFQENREAIDFAAHRLGMTPVQTVFMALFVDNSEDRSIYLSRIAEYIGCRTTRILRLTNELDGLEKRRYIRVSQGRNSTSYRVPKKVIKALRDNEPYIHQEEDVSDLGTFFDRFNSLMEEKNNDELTHDALLEQTKELLEKIHTSNFAKKLRCYSLHDEDLLLFIFMAHLFVENNDDNIGFHDLDNLFDDDELPSWCKRELRSRKSWLIKCGLIENTNEDGMARSDAFRLTSKAKEELLGELNITQTGKSEKSLTQFDSLPEKKLYYNAQEKSQIEELGAILSSKRFAGVQERLRKAGMRPGFCCLFYGSPGTGKTETVYQLARKTKRNILQVDVDKIKSCWVGESEKNIKALFDRYRAICKDSKNAPILLFNEADAVLGVRMEGASKAVDKMENSLQNIILQEMEKLEGIMIATTNLTTNLDKAFERRFLYKVKYERPSVESRAKIWQAMLPGLKKKDAAYLAARHDMSGGEIENIARKHTVNAILSGNDIIDIDRISDLCKTERIQNSTGRSVGFAS